MIDNIFYQYVKLNDLIYLASSKERERMAKVRQRETSAEREDRLQAGEIDNVRLIIN